MGKFCKRIDIKCRPNRVVPITSPIIPFNVDDVVFFVRDYPALFILKCVIDLMEEHSEVCSSENLVMHNGRVVYIKHVNAQLTKMNSGYAYICVDSDQKHREEKMMASAYERGKITDSELNEKLESAGRFVLVSSYMIQTEDVLDVYYTRQSAEQYFDIANGYANLTPLRIHSEETVRGMMMRPSSHHRSSDGYRSV